MRLALFDIDGTLLSDRGASRQAFADALRATYGYDGDLTRYDFSGRTDPQIARMVLSDTGMAQPEIDAGLNDLWTRYLEGLARNAGDGRIVALSGIRLLLERLEQHPSVVLGLLTGNIEPGARLKLGGAGLNAYFSFGAFGSDSADRNELAPIAACRAREHAGLEFRPEDVVIIGDSIYDVRCGVPHGATTIALASGKTPAEMLRAEKPHHFFDDATPTDTLLAAILGNR